MAVLSLALSVVEALLGLSQPVLILATVAILAAEAIKVLFILRRFRNSENGNVMKNVVLAECISFVVDSVFVCIVTFPYSAPRLVAVFSVCAIFIATRLSGSITLSRLVE